jgi:hypothetical protein
MLSNSALRVTVPSGSAFTATLAQHAALHARIALPEGVGAGRHARSYIRSIQVVSVDNLAWEFWFWGNANGQQTGHPDLEAFRGRHSFVATDGLQIAGTGLWYYSVDDRAIGYADEDARANPSAGCFLNVTLVNRSAGAKTVNGWFQVAFLIEPTTAG